MTVLAATRDRLLTVDPDTRTLSEAADLVGRRLTRLTVEPLAPGRARCGTSRDGLWRRDDVGHSWRPAASPPATGGWRRRRRRHLAAASHAHAAYVIGCRWAALPTAGQRTV